MRLFTIGPDFQAELNRDWISLIPEFNALLKRDKGSTGDYRGDKKLKAKRELTFIYLDLDFTSPLREYPEDERREIAMKDAGLTETDMDATVLAAHQRYNQLLLHNSRSLKTLRAVEKSLDQLDSYFENIDFTLLDKKGELLHSPKDYLANLKTLKAAYESVDEFRDRVKQELAGDGGIRGNASLGGKEGKRKAGWEETRQPDTPIVPMTSFSDIGHMLREVEQKEDGS